MTSIALDSNSAISVGTATAEAVLQLVSSFADLCNRTPHADFKANRMQATMAQQIALSHERS